MHVSDLNSIVKIAEPPRCVSLFLSISVPLTSIELISANIFQIWSILGTYANQSFVFVFLFVCFFLSNMTDVDLSVNAFANILVGDIVSSGSFLGTEAFEEVEEKSAFDCVMRCVKTSGCRTIDYKRRGNDCFLNSKSRREVGLINSDDYVHYDVIYHTQKSEEADFGPFEIDMVS